MTKNYIFYFVCLFVVVLISSCSPPEPNFDINNVDLMASEVEPEDNKDSTLVKRVFANDVIYLTDISEKLDKIKKRYWDTNGDGEWEEDFQDLDFVELSYQEEGFHKIVFCTNEKDNCVTKWVYVVGGLDLPVPAFIVFETYIETEERSYNLDVETENIFAKEELVVKVDGEDIDFDFSPEDNRLSARIRGLKRGEETAVEIQAHTPDGDITEHLTILRTDGSGGGGGGSPKDTEPSVEIWGGGKTVTKPNMRVKAVTKNYDGDELDITLNGKEITDYRTSGSKGNWVINLGLKEGNNKLVVSLPDKSKSARTSFKLKKDDGKDKDDEIQTPVVKYSGDKDFSSSKVDIIVQTEKVFQKNLSFTLDGQEIPFVKEKSYPGSTSNKTDWKLSLNLKDGNNRLSYKATNKSGQIKDDIILAFNEDPFVKEKERGPVKPATVGMSSSKREAFSKTCIALYTQDKFTITLLPNNDMELQSFKLYTNTCGGVKVTLEGDGETQSFKAALNAGRSTITFTPIDASLLANLSYTLTLEPLQGYHSSCSASAAPRLEKVTECDFTYSDHPSISVDQSQNPILYDLKIKYQ